MDQELIQKAYEIGVNAVKNCESCIPHYNKPLNDFLDTLDLKIGDSVPLLQAFNCGHYDETDRSLKEIMK